MKASIFLSVLTIFVTLNAQAIQEGSIADSVKFSGLGQPEDETQIKLVRKWDGTIKVNISSKVCPNIAVSSSDNGEDELHHHNGPVEKIFKTKVEATCDLRTADMSAQVTSIEQKIKAQNPGQGLYVDVRPPRFSCRGLDQEQNDRMNSGITFSQLNGVFKLRMESWTAVEGVVKEEARKTLEQRLKKQIEDGTCAFTYDVRLTETHWEHSFDFDAGKKFFDSIPKKN